MGIKAVIRSCGKQYPVIEGGIIILDKIDRKVGERFEFDSVSIAYRENGDLIPHVTVTAQIMETRRSTKSIVFKKRRRKSSKTMNGYRHPESVVKVLSIVG